MKMTRMIFAAKCSSCQTVTYPPRFTCPNCGGLEFEQETLGGEGILLTYTDIYALPIDFVQRYLTIGIVELDSGIRVLGQIVADEPSVGMKVKALVSGVREQRGEPLYGFQFVPA